MAVKQTAANFLVAQASALIYDAAMTTEANISGLTGLTLPLGFEMSTITVSEMGRRIDLVVPSGGAYTSIDIVANFYAGDPIHAILQAAALNSTKLTTLRFYLKQGCDFAALDLINDAPGAYLIGTYSPPTAASKNALYQNTISILPAGSSVLFIAHSAPSLGTNITFVSETTTGAGATATLSAGSWSVFGFEVGDVVLADKVGSNDPLYLQVETITGTGDEIMTFTESTGDSATIPDATGAAATQLHGATAIEVTGLAVTCN
jgi:hypothetical protein